MKEMKKIINNENAMKKFGAQIGALIKCGQTIELVGDVGAGKTTFTKGLAVGLGVIDCVQSPSFTISRVYNGKNNKILAHYDFYRLDDAGIMKNDLQESIDDDQTITVIEWGEVVKNILPTDYLSIAFKTISESVRQLDLQAHGQKSQSLLGGLK